MQPQTRDGRKDQRNRFANARTRGRGSSEGGGNVDESPALPPTNPSLRKAVSSTDSFGRRLSTDSLQKLKREMNTVSWRTTNSSVSESGEELVREITSLNMTKSNEEHRLHIPISSSINQAMADHTAITTSTNTINTINTINTTNTTTITATTPSGNSSVGAMKHGHAGIASQDKTTKSAITTGKDSNDNNNNNNNNNNNTVNNGTKVGFINDANNNKGSNLSLSHAEKVPTHEGGIAEAAERDKDRKVESKDKTDRYAVSTSSLQVQVGLKQKQQPLPLSLQSVDAIVNAFVETPFGPEEMGGHSHNHNHNHSSEPYEAVSPPEPLEEQLQPRNITPPLRSNEGEEPEDEEREILWEDENAESIQKRGEFQFATLDKVKEQQYLEVHGKLPSH
ncbi:hypothetical protein RFI_04276, partial [Reticulomyxa filosa]